MPKYLQIGISFIRKHYLLHLLITAVFCLISGGIISFQNLNEIQSAKVLEMYMSFAGILLLVPLFLPEQDEEIWLLEKSKATPLWHLYLVRLLIGILVMTAVAVVFLFRLKNGNSEVVFDKMFIGAFAEMLFLGAIGFFVSGVTNQAILGYMVSVIYYAVNVSNNKFLGVLALFQMAKRNYDFAGWMLLASCFIFMLGIIIRENKSIYRS